MGRSLLLCAATLALAGCAMFRAPQDPARHSQSVSLVNSLSWTNALSGKRDGLRSAWPLAELDGHTENFPIAQIRQCEHEGQLCRWGVLNASRTFSNIRYVPGGVALDLNLALDVDRRQEVRGAGADAALAIPADVPALRATRSFKGRLVLPYGKVHRIDFDFGIAFELCPLRLDAARKNVDTCEVGFF